MNYKSYIDNLNEYFTLQNSPIDGDSNIDFITFLRLRSEKYRELQKSNEKFLNENIYKYEKNINLLNLKHAQALEELAGILYTNYKPFETGIALKICEILYKYYLNQNNLNKTVEMIYKCGFYQHDLYRQNPTKPSVNSKMLLKYMAQYFDLNKQSRNFFCRGLNNILIGWTEKQLTENYQELVRLGLEFMEFYNNPSVRELDSDFPFDNWVFVIERNMTTVLSVFRNNKGDDATKLLVYKLGQSIKDKALNEVYKTTFPVLSNCYYVYYASAFHAGKITIDELLENLLKLSKTDNNNPYSLESISSKIKNISYFLEYARLYKAQSKRKLDKEIPIVINDVINYVKKLEGTNEYQFANNMLAGFICAASNYYKFDDQIKETIFTLAVYRHIPTYIHTLVVKEITVAIVKYMLKYNPEYFVYDGYYDKVEDVIANSNEIIDDYIAVAKFHDIGKFYCLNVISNCYRKLTDDEFYLIKLHPLISVDKVLQNTPKIVMEAMKYHHLYFNEQDGYPAKEEEIVHKRAINILSVADSIDAATDNIGRSYAVAKSLDEIIADLRKESNVRYSGEILDLLDEEELYFNIKKILNEYRPMIYYSAYNKIK